MNSNNSEIRKHYFLNKYVIITPGRDLRPHYIQEQSIESEDTNCVLCPKNIESPLLISYYGENPWEMAVLKNKFPCVTLENPRAFGTQEVIIETPHHNKKFSELNLAQYELYFKVMSERLNQISAIKDISYILQFKNNGSKAGASIKHSHSQIFATDFLPPDVKEELDAAEIYKKSHNRCPYCQIIESERQNNRLIYADEHVVAFTPYASMYHYEAWIFPIRHTDNLTTVTKEEINSISKCLQSIVKRLDHAGISYNFFMHQAISRADQHFYIKIEPRDKNIWAGIELGSGVIVNSVSPEKAAEFYTK